MRKKLYALFLFLLILTSDIVFGKETNKSKPQKLSKKVNNAKENSNIERIKRSLDDEEDKPFWANRGKKKIENNLSYIYDNDADKATKVVKRNDNFDKEPFWGMRGRRESESNENNMDEEYPIYSNDPSNCKHNYGGVRFDGIEKNFKDRRDENIEPFWGNRGRRSPFSELEDANEPFWGNRGRRQENEPFWGTRGRRQGSPFWGARGRREDEPFWGNRGRRGEEPFWGNRGRRQESEPFWGNRGRREDEPFWGQRGRRKETEPFWDNREMRKEDFKDSIINTIDLIENDIEHLSRLRRSDRSSFWSNRGRNSKLKHLFDSTVRNSFPPQQINREYSMNLKSDPRTVHDNRIYADEPHYIVVERSSRSSAEAEDPFYISRGKKYYLNYNLVKAARDRRGAIEEIVKSVRNDPYYIARGKKDDIEGKPASINSTSEEEFMKAKELVCSAIDLISPQHHGGKTKREIDSDRDRRTILKKLAAQLQIDPYYVSRGKRSDGSLNGNLHQFITDVAEKCE